MWCVWSMIGLGFLSVSGRLICWFCFWSCWGIIIFLCMILSFLFDKEIGLGWWGGWWRWGGGCRGGWCMGLMGGCWGVGIVLWGWWCGWLRCWWMMGWEVLLFWGWGWLGVCLGLVMMWWCISFWCWGIWCFVWFWWGWWWLLRIWGSKSWWGRWGFFWGRWGRGLRSLGLWRWWGRMGWVKKRCMCMRWMGLGGWCWGMMWICWVCCWCLWWGMWLVVIWFIRLWGDGFLVGEICIMLMGRWLGGLGYCIWVWVRFGLWVWWCRLWWVRMMRKLGVCWNKF